jgi:hypothetical protein
MRNEQRPAAISAVCSGLRYVESIKVYRLNIDIPKETAPDNISVWVDKYLAVAILNNQSKPDEFKTPEEREEDMYARKKPDKIVVKRRGKTIKKR